MRKFPATIVLSLASLLIVPSALAMSPSQCAVKSAELNKTGSTLAAENVALKQEAEAIEAFGIEVDDAVTVANFSADHKKKAADMKAEFTARQTSYNDRLVDFQVRGAAFTEERNTFSEDCSKYFKK